MIKEHGNKGKIMSPEARANMREAQRKWRESQKIIHGDKKKNVYVSKLDSITNIQRKRNRYAHTLGDCYE